MSHGLTLDHAAWSSPWRVRSLRDKSVLSLGLLISAIALPPFPGAAAVAVISLVILLGPVQLGWYRLVRIAWVPAVSILIGVATVLVSVSWDGRLNLQITATGLTQATNLGLRASAATLAMLVLACSTPMVDIFAGLRKARVPDPLIEIAALIYRLTFGLLENAGAIRSAQEARLGYANRRSAMRSASMAAAVLFLRSWDRAQQLEDGLAGRGYTDSLKTLEPQRFRSTWFLVGTLAALGAVVTCSSIWMVIS
jgi:cobalt/nickel transport system permease protein